MTAEHDYTKFASAAPSGEALADLSKAAIDLYQAELEVSRLEGELKAAQKKVEDISTHVIPDLMDLAGLEELSLKNGTKLKVEPILTIGSGAGKNPAVLAWIEETGHSGLIKRSVAVSLGKDADEKELKLLEELKAEGFTDVSALREVNAQTLKAHVKKLLEAGKDVDMDLLGAREFKRAKITGQPKDGSSAFGE
jgi:hypothetical protein